MACWGGTFGGRIEKAADLALSGSKAYEHNGFKVGPAKQGIVRASYPCLEWLRPGSASMNPQLKTRYTALAKALCLPQRRGIREDGRT